MTVQFRPARRERTPLLIGIAGPSSSGKTFSALRLAQGITGGGKVALIDTESRRALHYADRFTFDHGELAAPFRPEAYLEALHAAEAAGAEAIIVDSMSHEHEGPGGLLEWQEEELDRMAGDDFAKRERVKFTAWIKPKRAHNRFLNGVLQLNVHLIFCFRAKEKLRMVKDDRGKTQIIPTGWQPICSDRFEYEMTTLLMLPPGANGVPDLAAQASKVQEQHAAMFPPGKQIDEATGEALATWARGAPAVDALALAKDAAAGGREAFKEWWNGDGKPHRAALKPHMDALRKIATDAEDGDPLEGSETVSMSTAEFQEALGILVGKAEVGGTELEAYLASDRYKQAGKTMTDKQRQLWAEQVHEVLGPVDA